MRRQPRGAADAAVARKHLRERDEGHIDITGSGELPGLGNVFTDHDLAFPVQLVPQAKLCQNLLCRSAVGGSLRIGDANKAILLRLQHLAAVVDQAGLRAPKYQRPDGIGKAASGNRQTLIFQQLRLFAIGR